MKVVITGITGFRNRGVEALVVPIVEQIRAREPDSAFTILTRTPDYDAQRLAGPNVEFVLDKLGRGRLDRLKARGSRYHRPLSTAHARFMDAVRAADVVISSGGDIFSSDYGAMTGHLLPLHEALRVGTPVVFLAHSIGPFKSSEEISQWKDVAQRSTLVTLRETRSHQYVTGTLGLSSPDLAIQTADTAFLLDPAPPPTVDALMKSFHLNDERPRVGLSMSCGIRTFAGLAPDAHAKAWTALVRFVIEELDAHAVLVPHVQDASGSNDDRLVQSQLLRSLDYDPRITLLGPDLSAREFKGILSRCDLVIAERMHAAIGALSMETPTLAVKYSIKAEGIMHDLLGPELAPTFLVEIQDFLADGSSVKAARQAWDRREDARSRLSAAISQTKKSSAANFDLLFERTRGSHGRQRAAASGP